MEHFIIAITRKCGSGGTTIGKMLAKRYGVSLYDRQLMRLASEDSGINEAIFADADEEMKSSLLYRISKKVYQGELIPPESNHFLSDQNLFNYQAKVLRELAKHESYIVIGRGADYILRDLPNVLSVFITADMEDCIEHEMEKLCVEEREAKRYIQKMNKFRSDYYSYHTGNSWENPENFDLCINTSHFGYERSVELIERAGIL